MEACSLLLAREITKRSSRPRQIEIQQRKQVNMSSQKRETNIFLNILFQLRDLHFQIKILGCSFVRVEQAFFQPTLIPHCRQTVDTPNFQTV